MKRRTFLGLMSAGVVSLGAPFYPTVASHEFDWTAEHGQAVCFATGSGIKFADYRNMIRDELVQQARRHLPKGAPFEIRITVPMDYGRRIDMAWYYSPGMGMRGGHKVEVLDEPVWVPHLGVYRYGGYIA